MKLLVVQISLFFYLLIISASSLAFQCNNVGTVVIDSVADLQKMAACVNDGNSEKGVIFNLNKNINLANVNFTPIGDSKNSKINRTFDGVFNGNGHTINRLHIDSNSLLYSGLFGKIGKDAVIKNIHIVSAKISNTYDPNYMGVLAGVQEGGLIKNSSVTGTIVIKNNHTHSYIGGLVGIKKDGIILNSCASVIINSHGSVDYSGGLVGEQIAGTIMLSSANGSIISDNNSSYNGGFVGSLLGGVVRQSDADESIRLGSNAYYNGGLIGFLSDGAKIKNSYSKGNLILKNNDRYNGYLVGKQEGDIVNSYATTTIYNENRIKQKQKLNGQFVGFYLRGLCECSYWRVNKKSNNNQKACQDGEKNTVDMKNIKTYLGWDFQHIWGITPDRNGGYPYLKKIKQ